MSQKTLNDSIQELVEMAEHKGRTDARAQVMDLITSFLDKPEVINMSATEAISWIVNAIKMEFQFDQPGQSSN